VPAPTRPLNSLLERRMSPSKSALFYRRDGSLTAPNPSRTVSLALLKEGRLRHARRRGQDPLNENCHHWKGIPRLWVGLRHICDRVSKRATLARPIERKRRPSLPKDCRPCALHMYLRTSGPDSIIIDRRTWTRRRVVSCAHSSLRRCGPPSTRLAPAIEIRRGQTENEMAL
jgi:hypothetical protein